MAGDGGEIYGTEMRFNIHGMVEDLRKNIETYIACPAHDPDKGVLRNLIIEEAGDLKSLIVDELQWQRQVGGLLKTANLQIVSGCVN